MEDNIQIINEYGSIVIKVDKTKKKIKDLQEQLNSIQNLKVINKTNRDNLDSTKKKLQDQINQIPIDIKTLK